MSPRRLVLLLIALLIGVPLVLSSCSGGGGGGGGTAGGGGGGGGGTASTPPLIAAEVDSFAPGSTPPGFTTNVFVAVLDPSSGASITSATVTINAIPLSYNATNQDYEGSLLVAPGNGVVLSVTVGGNTFTASATQFTSYPTITAPAPADTWSSGVANNVNWSGGAPMNNASYGLAVLDAGDPNAPIVWPLDHFLLDTTTNTTSFDISPGSITAGRRLVVVGIEASTGIANADPSSSLTIIGLTYAPITVTGMPVTSQSSGTGNNLNGVVWSGTQFVAVGEAGTVLTSPDGVTWTSRSSGTADGLRSVAWSGSKFVAVGGNPGTALTSSDGITWAKQDLSGISFGGQAWILSSVVSSGTQFAAVGSTIGGFSSSEVILTSPDGITWTSRPYIATTHSDLRAIAWSGTQFVAVGGTGEILSSADGVTWTAQSSPASQLDSIVWSGTQFVAGGSGGTVLTSPNGTTWTSHTSGTLNGVLAVAWTGVQFVATGPGGTFLSSPDGATWSIQASGTSNFMNGFASGTKLVMVGTNGTIVTSP